MEMLLKHGLDPLDVHQDGFAPLHRACWGKEPRHSKAVRVLLKAGVPYDLKAGNGQTCTMMTRNQKTLKVLRKFRKAQQSAMDSEGKPVLEDQ